MPECLICKTYYEPFVNFGKMPIANGFLFEKDFNKEYFYDLKVGYCSNCHMVQLVDQPEREKMFNENYAFFSGTSKNMAIHFRDFAEGVINDYLPSKNAFVVEIGSNDGIMLQNFALRGIKHLGIEPSKNVAEVAVKKGINTISEFFDKDLSKKIVEEYGKADVFLAANVMCHIPYQHSVIDGINELLMPGGVVIFEDPYLGNIIKNTIYDQIYDEHVFLFSALSIKNLFDKHGMEIIDLQAQETHGGSMRYYIARKGMRKISPKVKYYLEKEIEMGLNAPEIYEKFRMECEVYRDKLVGLIKDIRKNGKRIVGYAATSKSTTIINYCGLNSNDIQFISDTTPIKQGKFSPGAHIPVKPYEEFKNNYPDYALLFAYNHSNEIMQKEKEFMNAGGKWIVYVPEIMVK